MTEEESAEYKAAHDSFHHYDAFRWTPGSITIVSAAVLWGFLLNREAFPAHSTVAAFSCLITLISASWLYLSHHFRQLFMSKLYRIHEIEHKYDMRLNLPHGFMGRQSSKNDRVYPNLGPRGHNIDIALFVTISLFGPVVAVFEGGFDRVYLLPAAMVIFVVANILLNEVRIRRLYNAMSPYT